MPHLLEIGIVEILSEECGMDADQLTSEEHLL
jgi:hypothetical protein